MVTTLEKDSIRNIFNSLKLLFSNTKETKEIITNMHKYSVVGLLIPAGVKACGCAIGFREKPNNEGEVLQVWSHEPMGTDSDDEINVMDPNPIITLQTFPRGEKSHIGYGLDINYKIGSITTGSLPPFITIVQEIQNAFVVCFLNK